MSKRKDKKAKAAKNHRKVISRPNNLPQEVPPVKTVLQQTRLEASYIGPIPPPAMLKEYNAIVPGSADRILQMAEQQANHRMILEKTVVIGDSKRSDKGLYAGVFVAIFGIVAAVYLIYTGHQWSGIGIFGGDIVSFVFVFVYGTRSRKQERMDKAAIMKRQTGRS